MINLSINGTKPSRGKCWPGLRLRKVALGGSGSMARLRDNEEVALVRRLTRVLTLFVACLALSLARGADDPRSGDVRAKIVAPKEGAAVDEVEEYKGQLTRGGWPVVVVRPLIEGEPWYVQSAVGEVAAGQFSGRAHFGASDTPQGAKFVLVVLVAEDKKAAAKFKAGTALNGLPADLPPSREITVYRDAKRAAGQPPRERRALKFAGRTWLVKAARRIGPGPNDFSDAKDNVWLDDKDRLHLAITPADGGWRCAEVVADKSLGYGEYVWVVSGDLPALDRRAVLGLFTYENESREIDFEFSRWGDSTKPNAQFVVQPYTVKGNMHRFDTGNAKVLTVSLLWRNGQVRCRCWDGGDTSKEPLADWRYTGRHTPAAGRERVRANLWLVDGKAPASDKRQEVIIHSFEHKPVEAVRDRRSRP